jgi:hypothetical protein
MESRKAEWLRKQGYTIAGFSDDLYEGAEFCYPGMYFGEGEEPDEYFLTNTKFGKVLQIVKVYRYTNVDAEEEIFDLEDLQYEYDRKLSARELAERKEALLRHFLISFVWLDEDGNQIPDTWGAGLELYFKDPEAKV